VVAAGHPVLAVLGLLGSYVGLYFYLRVIMAMFMSPAEAGADGTVTLRRYAFGASLVCLLPIALVTVFPGWVLGMLRA
jgi:NADH-quinone oxidoreductase subunit N